MVKNTELSTHQNTAQDILESHKLMKLAGDNVLQNPVDPRAYGQFANNVQNHLI